MSIDGLQMNEPATVAFGLLLAAVLVVLVGDAVQRVIDTRRKWDQRDRELIRLDLWHDGGKLPPAAATPA